MTVFDRGRRCYVDTCFWYPNKNVVFGILKASHFFIMTLFQGGPRCQTKTCSHDRTTPILNKEGYKGRKGRNQGRKEEVM
jgi:hypothetical protein